MCFGGAAGRNEDRNDEWAQFFKFISEESIESKNEERRSSCRRSQDRSTSRSRNQSRDQSGEVEEVGSED